jgi:hypothetical protein
MSSPSKALSATCYDMSMTSKENRSGGRHEMGFGIMCAQVC